MPPALLGSLAIAIVMGLLTMGLVPAISHIPLARWQMGALLKLGGVVAASAAIAGVLVGVIVREPMLAAGAATGGGLVALVRLVLRFSPMRRVKRAVARLARPETRADAVRETIEAIDASRPTESIGTAISSWAGAVLVAASHCFDHRELEATEEVLSRLHGLSLDPNGECTRASLSAMVCAFRGERAPAQAAIDAAVAIGRVLPLTVALRDAAVALVAALGGRPDDAIASLEGWGHAPHLMQRIRLEARASACAARGETEAARRALFDLERNHGAAAVGLLAELPGPASELAASLHQATAYR
ncbi:MAG: hypothetical protein AB7S26_12300 [Sandaracinaceae bacterium]